MNIVRFPECNVQYNPPKGFEDEMEPLPAWKGEVRYQDGTRQTEVISCWKLSPEEIEEVKKTGEVWLSIHGEVVPPVRIDGIKPIAQFVHSTKMEVV